MGAGPRPRGREELGRAQACLTALEGSAASLPLAGTMAPSSWREATVGHPSPWRSGGSAGARSPRAGVSGTCGGAGRTLCLLTRVGSSPSPALKQGTPKLLRTSDCDFVFEWETPLVCPDEVKAEGCSLTDEQLHYSFNLSSLSKSTFKVALLPRRPPSRGRLLAAF